MKVNAISALLLLFVASASGQQCKDLGIFDSDDCASECKGLANGKGSSSWKMKYDSDGNLTKCECTTSNKGSFTCKSEPAPAPAPEPPEQPTPEPLGQCKDLGIFTSDDCASECKGLANGKGSSKWSMNYDSDGNLTKCECTTSNKGSFTCTSERTPEPPVNYTEGCPRSIRTWDQCKSYCASLSGNYHVSHRSRNGRLTQCSCNYGPNRQNNYTCYLEREDVKSSLRSS